MVWVKRQATDGVQQRLMAAVAVVMIAGLRDLSMAALTGPALVAKVDELKAKGASKGETARACGYISTKADGKIRTNFTGFYEALLSAQGMINDRPKRGGGGVPGRPLSYQTKVLHKVGHAIVGARYLSQIGAKEGDVMQISIKRGKIVLEPAAPVNTEA
ncbi:MAG: AbrB-like transcriptional regulator [Synechococcaceae cyanobacterium]|nr:AbrB-like transcriptional regulator [Synechococcaceae cyanobacterium]